MINDKTLDKIERFTLDEIHKRQDILMYHDFGHQNRIKRNIHEIGTASGLDDESLQVLHLAKLIMGVTDARNQMKTIDFVKGNELLTENCKLIFDKYDLDQKLFQRVERILHSLSPLVTAKTLEEKVYTDAFIADFTGSKGRDRLKRFYEEMILREVNLGKISWIDLIIAAIESNNATSEYGKEHIQPKVEKLKSQLKKEKKALDQQRKLLLKKELNISDGEIKKLKKDMEKAKGRDDRGIQTLFRTTIKNHYTLNEMVDRKANIMITVNSIILSLVIGGVIGTNPKLTVQEIPILILVITAIASIIYAILSIRPVKTQGDFTEEDIRNKQGNLLYFGNFHNMHFRDFEWAFLQMLNDKDYLYGSMIRDYYHLAVGLHKKYTYQRHSLNIFLIGFIVSISLRLIFRVVSII